MNKVLVIGCCGAGKSTFSKKLAQHCTLELVHLDRYFWNSGWVAPSKEEWKGILEQLVTKEHWIMDGNYGSTLDVRIPHADTIIYLDVPRWKCMWRAVKRMITYWGKGRSDMAEGCLERFDLPFFKFIWNYPTKKRPGILKKLGELQEEKTIHILKTDRDMDGFIQEVAREKNIA